MEKVTLQYNELYTIQRINNGWLVKTSEHQAVFQDDDSCKFNHEESESLSRLLQDTFGDNYGRWKRQGGITVKFNDKGFEQESLDRSEKIEQDDAANPFNNFWKTK